MITFEPISIAELLQLVPAMVMPIVVLHGIRKMVNANDDRAAVGQEMLVAIKGTQEALQVSVDALRELLERGK